MTSVGAGAMTICDALEKLVETVDNIAEEQKSHKATLVAIYDLVLSVVRKGPNTDGNGAGLGAAEKTIGAGTGDTTAVVEGHVDKARDGGVGVGSKDKGIVGEVNDNGNGFDDHMFLLDSESDEEFSFSTSKAGVAVDGVKKKTKIQLEIEEQERKKKMEEELRRRQLNVREDRSLKLLQEQERLEKREKLIQKHQGEERKEQREEEVRKLQQVDQERIRLKEEAARWAKKKEEEERIRATQRLAEARRQADELYEQQQQRLRERIIREKEQAARAEKEKEAARERARQQQMEEAKKLQQRQLAMQKEADLKRQQEEHELKKKEQAAELELKMEKEKVARLQVQKQLEAKKRTDLYLRRQKEMELEQERLNVQAELDAINKKEKEEKEKLKQQQQQRSSAKPSLPPLPMKRNVDQLTSPSSPQLASPTTPSGGVNGRMVHAGGSAKKARATPPSAAPDLRSTPRPIAVENIRPTPPPSAQKLQPSPSPPTSTPPASQEVKQSSAPSTQNAGASGQPGGVDDALSAITNLDATTAYSKALDCRETDPERCLRLLHHAASLNPNESAITHALACVLLKGTPSTRADATGAVELLKSNVSVHHIDSMMTLAEILRMGRPQDHMPTQPDDAARLCEAVMEYEPNNTAAMVMRANLLREQKDPPASDADETMAFKLYSRAASLGSMDGVYRKGHFLITMAPQHKKAKQAYEGRRLVEEAANTGHSGALFFLGHCYEFPDRYWKGLFSFTGSKLDYEKLVYTYYKRAAEAGNGDALNNVGSCICAAYAGLEPDFDSAREYYERAIEAGSRDGYDNLAMLYETGMDERFPDRVSHANALNYYRLGAKRDIPQCLMHLGNAHEDGLGTLVKKDRRKAEKYYSKALRLARLYDEDYTEEQTLKDLRSLHFMNIMIHDNPNEVARSRKVLHGLMPARACTLRLKALHNALYAVIYESGDIDTLSELIGDSNAAELVDFAKTQLSKESRGEVVDLSRLFGKKTRPGKTPINGRLR